MDYFEDYLLSKNKGDSFEQKDSSTVYNAVNEFINDNQYSNTEKDLFSNNAWRAFNVL